MQKCYIKVTQHNVSINYRVIGRLKKSYKVFCFLVFSNQAILREHALNYCKKRLLKLMFHLLSCYGLRDVLSKNFIYIQNMC